MIPMYSSYISPTAIDRVSEVLRSGMLSEGKLVERFEREFEKVFNLPAKSFVATNSGTSALHLALETLGVRGEVLLPANTFVATGMAVLMAGCVPVFCDILPDGTIDPWDVEKKITSRTGAVIGVNWAGKACSNKLELICMFNLVPLIIDAAQSLGVKIQGNAICYSFQATKHLTTGDGGGVHFVGIDDAKKARELRWFGISKHSEVGVLGERKYELDRVGYKYHMNDYAAALGLANLEGIGMRLGHYVGIAHWYMRHLSLKSVVPVHKETWNNAFWAFPIIPYDMDVVRFSKFCKDREISCSIIHRGIDHNPVFGWSGPLPVQREWEQRVTHLPVHADMSYGDVVWICEKVNQYE